MTPINVGNIDLSMPRLEQRFFVFPGFTVYAQDNQVKVVHNGEAKASEPMNSLLVQTNDGLFQIQSSGGRLKATRAVAVEL